MIQHSVEVQTLIVASSEQCSAVSREATATGTCDVAELLQSRHSLLIIIITMIMIMMIIIIIIIIIIILLAP